MGLFEASANSAEAVDTGCLLCEQLMGGEESLQVRQVHAGHRC